MKENAVYKIFKTAVQISGCCCDMQTGCRVLFAACKKYTFYGNRHFMVIEFYGNRHFMVIDILW